MEASVAENGQGTCEEIVHTGPRFSMDDVGHEQSQQPKKETKSATDTKVTATMIRQLCEKQEYRCALTGVNLTPQTASLDHAVPISRGGENSIANCQIVTQQVNRMKGLMTNDEFIEVCGRVHDHRHIVNIGKMVGSLEPL